MGKVIGINFYSLSSSEKDSLIEKQCNINMLRLRIIFPILFFVNVALLIIDITKFNPLWESIEGYKNLFYLHIFALIGLSIIIVLPHIKILGIKERVLKRTKIFTSSSLIFILLWSILLSLNAQLIHGQISAYIITVFCISAIFISSPIYNIIIYFTSQLIFIIGLLIISQDSQQLNGNIINSTFLVILAIIVSNINFSNFVRDFKNKITINKINDELKESHDNLERAVMIKTEELEKTSKTLIDEINKRHEIEVEILNNKLKYEKEKNILNKKIEYEELRTEFFANISHELKTPLNVIFGSQQMMRFYLEKGIVEDNNGRLDKNIKLIKQNCYRLIRLIGNLIDITKIDVGNYDIHIGNYDIVKIVKEITFSVFDYANTKEVDLEFTSEIKEKIIACDPDKIERIILNLLSNAVKFTPPDGTIYVKVYERNDEIFISVKDTGIGIPYDLQSMIFERFVQVDKSIKREREGSGIGLSLVKSLVNLHGGDISLVSVPKKGSEFIISLPNKTVESSIELIGEVATTMDEKVERINLEFSDIYS